MTADIRAVCPYFEDNLLTEVFIRISIITFITSKLIKLSIKSKDGIMWR